MIFYSAVAARCQWRMINFIHTSVPFPSTACIPTNVASHQKLPKKINNFASEVMHGSSTIILHPRAVTSG